MKTLILWPASHGAPGRSALAVALVAITTPALKKIQGAFPCPASRPRAGNS